MTDTRRCFKFLSLLINYKVNIEPCEWVGMSFLCPFVGYLLSKATLINIDLSHRIKNDFVCCTCMNWGNWDSMVELLCNGQQEVP